MSEGSNNRWFRFGLRTMFVAVVVLGILLGWLGYRLNWIRQRHNLLANPTGERLLEWSVDDVPGGTPAPGWLWLFGERGHPVVLLTVVNDDPESPTDIKDDVSLGMRLFPEAQIAVEYERRRNRQSQIP